MHTLFPDIAPYRQEALPVDDIHTLYVEECGHPDGLPVLFVHGGPGGGCSKTDRRYFDPERYRIILFDQRGCGRSTPHAELQNNTTQHLIDDIETIRRYLGVDKWVLFGGSWGSTLSLLYAQSYPDRVMGLILRGIYLCREKDFHWFYQEGASRIFPDFWQDYLTPIPPEERGNMIDAYYKRLTGSNELAKMAAAKAWSLWEGRCATLKPNTEVVDHFGEPHRALAIACIEAHYFVNKAFIEPNQILNQANRLADIPGVIVHGRYDMVCPLDNATALYDVWPESELDIIRDAGHSSRERGIVDALVRATHDMAALLTGDPDDSV